VALLRAAQRGLEPALMADRSGSASLGTTVGLMPVGPVARVVRCWRRLAPSATTPPPHRPEERSQRSTGSRTNRTPWPHWGCDRNGGVRSSCACTASRRRPSPRRSLHRPDRRRKCRCSTWPMRGSRFRAEVAACSSQRVDLQSRKGLPPRQIDQRQMNWHHQSPPYAVYRVPI
jgi:hypothetical protein